MQLVCLVALTGCRTTSQRAKLEELQSLAAEIPKFPEFKQSRYQDISKPGMATVTYYYDCACASRIEPVRDFYVKELTARGWTQEKAENRFGKFDSPLTFHKGNYKIVFTRDELLQQYSLDFAWHE